MPSTTLKGEARADACEVVAEALLRAAHMLGAEDQYGKWFDEWAQSIEDHAVKLRLRDGFRVIPGGRR